MTLTAHTPLQIVPQALAAIDPASALARAKYAYSTRFIEEPAKRGEFELSYDLLQAPKAGDVVLARVVEIGQHKRLESPVSRRQKLFEGDEIVVAYGSRYAADQFLSLIPTDLGPCHLTAAGGLASRVIDQHDRMDDATLIEPVGLLIDRDGARVNLRDYAPYGVTSGNDDRAAVSQDGGPTVISVLGTSMNSGKSTTLACLAHGLVKAGLRVHVGKATGTGAGNDSRLFEDAGAQRVLDFTDFGHATTFGLSESEVRDIFTSLVDELSQDTGEGAPDVVIVEIADGIFQGETRDLLADPKFVSAIDSLVFSAGDALGAVGGLSTLTELGHTPIFVSGVLTSSPLATREAITALDVPVIGTFDLCDGNTASRAVGLGK